MSEPANTLPPAEAAAAAQDAEIVNAEPVPESAPARPMPRGRVWVKGGPSPNPGGRPKNAISLVSLLRQRLTKENGTEIVDALIRLAREGDIKAIALVMERLHGKTESATILNQVNIASASQVIHELSDTELERMLKEAQEREPDTQRIEDRAPDA